MITSMDDEMCDAYVASFEETMEKDAEEVKEDKHLHWPCSS